MKKKLTDYYEFQYGTSITGYVLIIYLFIGVFCCACSSKTVAPKQEPPKNVSPKIKSDVWK